MTLAQYAKAKQAMVVKINRKRRQVMEQRSDEWYARPSGQGHGPPALAT
jgi:hypothetical protein